MSLPPAPKAIPAKQGSLVQIRTTLGPPALYSRLGLSTVDLARLAGQYGMVTKAYPDRGWAKVATQTDTKLLLLRDLTIIPTTEASQIEEFQIPLLCQQMDEAEIELTNLLCAYLGIPVHATDFLSSVRLQAHNILRTLDRVSSRYVQAKWPKDRLEYASLLFSGILVPCGCCNGEGCPNCVQGLALSPDAQEALSKKGWTL